MQLLAATLCPAGKQNPMEITKCNVHTFIMPFQYILGFTLVDKLAVLQGWKKAKKIMGAGHKIKGSVSSCHPFHLHINPGSPISQLDSHMRDLCILSR
jgi:hypothetical protein